MNFDLAKFSNITELLKNEVFTQNCCNILTCLSFLGTLYLFICRYINGRKNINIAIIDYEKRYSKIIQLFISLQNQSSDPITIHSVAIVYNQKEYPCELLPKKVRGKNEFLKTTPAFPLNLSPKQGYLCFLEFLFSEDIPLTEGRTVALRIHTNRGPINKELTLGCKSHYLHIVQ